MLLRNYRQIIFSYTSCSRNCSRSKSTSPAEYCLDSVKRYDYENFMCTLLLRGKARSCAFAVRGFNVEVSRVGEQVSEPNIGLMRFKFWEEAINSCYANDVAKVPQHPVAIELYKAIRTSKLTKRYFNSLIMSRQEKLSMNSFKTLEDLENYAEKSVSSVYYLILEGSNVKNIHADHAASHLGKAQGIVQRLRSITVARKLNFVPYPQDILTKAKVSHEEILRAKPSNRLNDCSYEIASRAYQHLQKARSLLKDVPIDGRAVLLPAAAVEFYLNKLQKMNYDVLHPALQHRSLIWLPKIWFNHIRKMY